MQAQFFRKLADRGIKVLMTVMGLILTLVFAVLVIVAHDAILMETSGKRVVASDSLLFDLVIVALSLIVYGAAAVPRIWRATYVRHLLARDPDVPNERVQVQPGPCFHSLYQNIGAFQPQSAGLALSAPIPQWPAGLRSPSHFFTEDEVLQLVEPMVEVDVSAFEAIDDEAVLGPDTVPMFLAASPCCMEDPAEGKRNTLTEFAAARVCEQSQEPHQAEIIPARPLSLPYAVPGGKKFPSRRTTLLQFSAVRPEQYPAAAIENDDNVRHRSLSGTEGVDDLPDLFSEIVEISDDDLAAIMEDRAS